MAFCDFHLVIQLKPVEISCHIIKYLSLDHKFFFTSPIKFTKKRLNSSQIELNRLCSFSSLSDDMQDEMLNSPEIGAGFPALFTILYFLLDINM